MAGEHREPPQARPPTARLPAAADRLPEERPLPMPEDFADPAIAEAVRAMREAMRVGGGRRRIDGE